MFHHYLAHGRAEGRRGISVSETLAFDRQRLDASRETILLFAHDASRTGAPIIAYHIALRLQQKYNVVAVLLGAGELVPRVRELLRCRGRTDPSHRVVRGGSQASGDTSVRVLSRALRHREQHRNADGAPCAGPRSRPGGHARARVRVVYPARREHGPGARLVDPGRVPCSDSSQARLRENIPRFEAARFTCSHRGRVLPPSLRELGKRPHCRARCSSCVDRRTASTRWSCSGAARCTSGRESICFSRARPRWPGSARNVRCDSCGSARDISRTTILPTRAISRTKSNAPGWAPPRRSSMPSPTWNRRMRWLTSSFSVRGWIRCRT